MTNELEQLKRLALACTPQNLNTAEHKDDGNGEYVTCHICGGDGSIELETTYTNYDNIAIGVQFFGVGNEFGAADRYFRAANPAFILQLIEALERNTTAAPAVDEAIEVPQELLAQWRTEQEVLAQQMYKDKVPERDWITMQRYSAERAIAWDRQNRATKPAASEGTFEELLEAFEDEVIANHGRDVNHSLSPDCHDAVEALRNYVHALQSPRPASLTSEEEMLEWINKNEKYVETWGFSSDDLREFFAGKCLSPRAQQAEGVRELNAELEAMLLLLKEHEATAIAYAARDPDPRTEAGKCLTGQAFSRKTRAAKAVMDKYRIALECLRASEQMRLIPASTLTSEAIEPVAWMQRWKKEHGGHHSVCMPSDHVVRDDRYESVPLYTKDSQP
jgi:hypothetical protein